MQFSTTSAPQKLDLCPRVKYTMQPSLRHRTVSGAREVEDARTGDGAARRIRWLSSRRGAKSNSSRLLWLPQTTQLCLSTRSGSARIWGRSLSRRFNCVCMTHLSPISSRSGQTFRCVQVRLLDTNGFSATLGWGECIDRRKNELGSRRGDWAFLHQHRTLPNRGPQSYQERKGDRGLSTRSISETAQRSCDTLCG
jgi:hypothetical protein